VAGLGSRRRSWGGEGTPDGGGPEIASRTCGGAALSGPEAASRFLAQAQPAVGARAPARLRVFSALEPSPISAHARRRSSPCGRSRSTALRRASLPRGAGLAPLRGRSLLALNRGEIDQRLARLSDVAAVFVRPRLPAHAACVRDAGSLDRRPPPRHVRLDRLKRRTRRPSGRFICHTEAATDLGPPQREASTLACRLPMPMQPTRPGTRDRARSGVGRRIVGVRAADGELTFVLAQGPELRFGDATSLTLKLAVAHADAAAGRGDERVPRRDGPDASDCRWQL